MTSASVVSRTSGEKSVAYTVKPRFSERQNSEKPLFSDRFKADQISVFVLCNLQNSEKPQFSQQIAADQTVH